MKKKILITGSEGFIGSHVVEFFLKKNFFVKAFVYYNSFNSIGWLKDFKKSKNLEIFSGDVRNYDTVYDALKDCYAVIHLAALIGIPYSYNTPDSYVSTNVVGTLNVLQASRKLKTKRVIITSTSEVYGTAQYIPIDEQHPLNPQSPYAASKVAADALAQSFYKSYKLPVTIVRPFNTYGPRQSERAIIPTIINQILSNKVVELGNLTPTRDFTFVEDVAKAFYLVLNKKKSIGKIINIGSSFEISVKKLFLIIRKLIGKKNILKIINKRKRPKNSEVERLFADIKVAKKILTWNASYSGISGFKKGLVKTISWFNNSKNLQNYNSDIYNI